MVFPASPSNGDLHTSLSSVQYRFDASTGTWQIVSSSANGNIIYSNTTPTASDGNDGEYWYNITTNMYYGPKAAGAWPAATNTIGTGYYFAATTTSSGSDYVIATTTPKMNATGPVSGSILITSFNTTSTTTTPKLSVSGGAGITITKGDATALAVGDITGGNRLLLLYDSGLAKWLALMDLTAGRPVGVSSAVGDGNVIYANVAPSASNGQDGDYWYNTLTNQYYGPKAAGSWSAASTTMGCDFYNGKDLGGTGAAYTCTTLPGQTGTFRDGAVLVATIGATSTSTAPTLAANGGTARTIKGPAGLALAVGDLVAAHKVVFIYDSATNTWSAQIDLTTGSIIGASAATGNVIYTTTAPTTANAGDYYCNTDTNKWYIRSGAAWVATTNPANEYYNGGTTGGTGAAYTATTMPKLTDNPADGAILVVKMNVVNTSTTPTIALNSGTARTIRDASGNALAAGDLPASAIILMRWDSATSRWWALLNLSTGKTVGLTGSNTIIGTAAPVATDGQNGDYFHDRTNNKWYGPKASGAWPAELTTMGSDFYNLNISAGSATAYTSSSPRPDMANTGPRDGSVAIMTMHATNTGTNPTLTVSGGTARGMRRGGGTNLLAGDLILNHDIMMLYDATNNVWRCVFDLTAGAAIGSGTYSGKLLASGTVTAAAGATIADITGLAGWYRLLIMVTDDSGTNFCYPALRFSSDNGATFDTTGYFSYTTVAGTTTNRIAMGSDGTNLYKIGESYIDGFSTTSGVTVGADKPYGAGSNSDAVTRNALRIFNGSTTLSATFTYRLYGILKDF